MKYCPACKENYQDNFSHCPRDGMALTLIALWSNGSIIKEKYRILGPAGKGGMASVFKAEHIPFKELRALKVMSPELASDESLVRRFTQEALLTRKLQHPNAVRVDDIDKDETGSPFIVMEFIEGRSLRDAMNSGPLPVDDVVRLSKQVALALEAAHNLGIVHRDIKPGNILLAKTAAGEYAKVVDFGIARVRTSHQDDSHVTLTMAGWVLGSPAYLSPEQAAEKLDEEIDGRSDLYSLGVVMYQMLSGDLPLHAESTAGLLNAHLNVLPKPLHDRCPSVPRPLSDLVMSCLSKDRNLRPKDARAFIERLENKLSAISIGEKAKGNRTVAKPVITSQSPGVSIPRWAVLAGQFVGLLGVELAARGLAPLYSLSLGLGFLVAADVVALAIWQRMNRRNLLVSCVAALIGMSVAAIVEYGLNSVVQGVWARLVESVDVSLATLQQVSVVVSCLVWISVVGIVKSLARRTG